MHINLLNTQITFKNALDALSPLLVIIKNKYSKISKKYLIRNFTSKSITNTFKKTFSNSSIKIIMAKIKLNDDKD